MGQKDAKSIKYIAKEGRSYSESLQFLISWVT